jgi:DNA recombination protein RmuC
METVLWLITGALTGSMAAALLLWRQTAALRDRAVTAEAHAGRVPALETELAALRVENAELHAERRGADEKLSIVTEAQARLSDAFRALSSEALESNNRQFLQLAQTALASFQNRAGADLDARQKSISDIVTPVQQALSQVDAKLQALEVVRASAYSGLAEQVRSLAETQKNLHCETANLVKALRTPAVRGRWGEMQLKRVVEMAGMIEHCHFTEQETIHTTEGRTLRPDLTVRLPNQRLIVVDSKVPLAAYLDAMETADDDARAALLRDHAGRLRVHMAGLSNRAYWAQFDRAPDFVVAFLPSESFFSAALQHDPELIEYGISQRVLVATPTTLIALLKAVAYGWRQESLALNAEEIGKLGREIYERLGALAHHFAKVGLNLSRATDAYNQAVGTLESRVLVSARRMKEKGISVPNEIPPVDPIDRTPRSVEAPELTTGAGSPM